MASSEKVKEKEEEEKGKEVRDALKRDKLQGNLGSGSFSFLILAQNWPSFSAAAKGPQKRTEEVMRMQQEVQWKQQKYGEDRIEVKKEARVLRCILFDGSAWSAERRYMRRYR